jgi:hypothetical protein
MPGRWYYGQAQEQPQAEQERRWKQEPALQRQGQG